MHRDTVNIDGREVALPPKWRSALKPAILHFEGSADGVVRLTPRLWLTWWEVVLAVAIVAALFAFGWFGAEYRLRVQGTRARASEVRATFLCASALASVPVVVSPIWMLREGRRRGAAVIIDARKGELEARWLTRSFALADIRLVRRCTIYEVLRGGGRGAQPPPHQLILLGVGKTEDEVEWVPIVDGSVHADTLAAELARRLGVTWYVPGVAVEWHRHVHDVRSGR